MGTLSKDTFAGVTYAVMGMGTEGGRTPYQITVAAKNGWNGTPIAASGYSVGAMQFDFGQRSGTTKNPNIDPLNGKPYNVSFVDAVNDWAKSVGQSELSKDVTDALRRPGNSANFAWIDTSDRDIMRAFGQTPAGQTWINNHLEKGLIREYEPKVNAVLGSSAFNGWSESDLIVAASVLTKAQNQSPNGGFSNLNKTIQKSAAENTAYTLNDFLADTKTVEATNANYHFTKAADIAKDYVALRNSDEIGPILKAAETKIASADFSPTSIGPDGDLWLTHKITSDSKFRSSLVSAAAQAHESDTAPSVKPIQVGKQTALVVVIPEDDYLEIQAPKGQQSVIIKDGHSFFYDGGDAEGRHFAIKSLEVALATGWTKPSDNKGTSLGAPGHWEDTAKYDEEGNVISSEGRVWVSDVPNAATQIGNSNGSPTSAATPINHIGGGGIYLSRDGASATLPDGTLINAGDGGHLALNLQGGLVVTGPANGYGDAEGSVRQVITYSAAGKLTGNVLQQILPGQSQPLIQGQERTLTYTTEDGALNTVSARFQVGVGWVDSGTGESVLGIRDIIANPQIGSSNNPIQWQAPVAATPVQEATPAITEPSEKVTPTSTEPVTFHQIERDGKTYTANPNGTLERPVAEHPGWIELRDSTGGGVILDRDGAVMAQLQPGDRVSMMDDGLIAINDHKGNSVNRTVDEGQAGAFYQHPSNSTSVADAALEQLVDTFTNIDTSQASPGMQYADAGNGGVVSDGGGGSSGSTGNSVSDHPLAPATSAPAAPETIAISAPVTPNLGTPQDLQTFLSGPGASLSPAQQTTLASQLGHLGLGAVDGNTLSLHTLPGGGALLANAEGDIVGEISVAPNGSLHLQSNTINADGSTSPVDVHVTGSGQVMSHTDYQLSQTNAALNLIQGLDGLQHWDKMDDLGHFSSLLGLANSINTLSDGSLGNLGGLNTFSSYISLAQSLEHGNVLGTLSSINGLSGQAIDGALNSALGSTGVPYLGIAMALNDFEHHPGQSLGSMIGMVWGPLGSAIGGMIGGLLDAAGVFGDNRPPPPEGVTHFEWDAGGNIQIHVDFNQSHGGEMAQRTAQSVQGLLESIVQSINDRTADVSDNVAINPYLLPRVGFSQAGGAWIEMTTPDGGSYREMIQGENLAQRLFEILTENGGIAPAWQVQTQLGHMQQLLDQGAGQGEIAAQLGAGAGGHAYHGNQAYAIEGNATESADFKTQSFGALVVHLGAGVMASDSVQASTQALQALQAQHAELKVATSELYRDTEGDDYYEKTQWVSATDANGHVQGLLVLDYNGNGQIETRDILNLGGNVGQDGNLANDALAATAHAHLQRNNVEWLDANGDGVLDARDPAFAAIRLWVDLNQDARLDAGEQADLASLQITSIDFRTGEVTYADGHRDALSATTLQSDTEGVRYTQMQEADAEGKLHTINAGQMLEHEGYQGQVQVVDQGGVTRWGTVREATFEQDALRTGDWEGTAEQDQHRHGGTNVASAPTQTSATGAVSLGTVKRVDEQGKALTDKRVVFVPAIATLGQERADSTIDQMVRSAQEGAMAGGMGAGLGALSMVGLGAVQTTAFAAPDTERMHGGYADGNNLETTARTATQETTYAVRPDARRAYPGDAVPVEPVQGTWNEEPRRLVDAPPPPGVLADVDALQRAGLDLSAYAANHTPVREIRATLVSNATPDTAPAGDAASAVALPATTEMLLDLPKVVGEVLAGTEDTVLRIGTELLLANDSTANADAPLRISAVGNASHGQVSLQTSINGAGQTVTEVVFLPDPDFYGTASFTYTVTDPYGLSSTVTATLLVENVNDAPYAQGEVVSGASEDATFLIDKTVLLANDGDVDDVHSALNIGWVGNAAHGSVSLDANGNVVFTPDLNFNGNAEFEYRTVDPAGLLSPTVQVVIPVAAVNDAPLAVDDQFQTYVNSTMTIGFAQLIGNDSDVENDTLSLVDVGNASHGAVSIVNGQVKFVPTAGYTGTASFDYLADDGNGGQTWATAFVEVKPPPNLYASVNLYGASFYGTGYNSGWRIDMADVSFGISDDGDTAFSSVVLQSLSVLRTDYSRPEGSPGDYYYPYYAWQSMAGVNAFSYNNTYMNLDVQRGYGFTDFQSTWRITDDRGLTNIWHLNYSVSGGATSYMEYSGYVGPVVLSLDGSAPSYISTQYSQVRYDLDTDGIADKVAWAAPGSGVLGIDLNGDHQISNASEFAFKQYVEGAQTDLEGLKAFDTNGNGVLDAGDAQWAKFGVWEDKNADGQTQAGEYLTLDALGIATINLQSNGQMHSGAVAGGRANTDVTVMGDTTITRADGSTGVAADAMLAYQSGVHAQAAEADLARMALLFNQMANTSLSQDAEPLGFVPTQPPEAAVAHEELLALQAA